MRNLDFSINEFYHIYNRGADKRKIFINKDDYDRFIILLYIANSKEPVRIDMRRQSSEDVFKINRGETLVDIGAYCLMPNHFHILVKEKVENGISIFMQKLSTAYTMYFNKKHEHSGVLLQGVFKAEHVDTDIYLKYIYSYIHLNPIKLIDHDWRENGIKDKKQAQEFLETFKYSSYIDYLGVKRKGMVILNKEAFPNYFDNLTGFKETVIFWLEYNASDVLEK